MADFFNLISSTFGFCFSWMNDILVETGMLPLFLSAMSIYLVYRFLLRPLFSGGSSDVAKKSKGNKSAGGAEDG